MIIYTFEFPLDTKWESVTYLLTLLTDFEKNRVLRLLQNRDKVAKLFSILFQKYSLEHYTHIPYKNLDFSHSKQGKPYLTNHPCHFNISNSRNFIVLAVSNSEVGIDIEVIKPVQPSLAVRYFALEESYDVQNSLNPNHRFFDYWTLKEACLKYFGTGLRVPLNSFSVYPAIKNQIFSFQYQNATAHLFLTKLNETCPLSICSEFKIHFNFYPVALDTMIDFFKKDLV